MSKEKKAVLLLWTYIVLLFVPKSKNNTKNCISYNENYIYEVTPYATYNSKDIYIVGKDLAKELNDNNNIYIIDDRCDKDPDMSICNSYMFKNTEDINNILNLLLEYEKNNPSEWNRSFKSMKSEWIIHNICYYLNIQKGRTRQVDFNNSDEETYLDYLKMLREILTTNNTELENIKTKVLAK